MFLLDYSAWILALLASTLMQPAYASCQLKEKEIIGEWQAAGIKGLSL